MEQRPLLENEDVPRALFCDDDDSGVRFLEMDLRPLLSLGHPLHPADYNTTILMMM